MAIGRRDYTYGYIPELQTGGRTVVNKIVHVYNEIGGHESYNVIDYTVPAGKILYLDRIDIGSMNCNMFLWTLWKGSNVLSWRLQLGRFLFVAGASVRPVWTEGERLLLHCVNEYDDVDYLRGVWMGLLDNAV